MEDQVITPKYKFDQMEKELKELKELKFDVLKQEAANTLNVYLDLKYSDNYYHHHFRRNTPKYTDTKLLRISLQKGEEFPKEILEKIWEIKEKIDQNTADLIKREYKVSQQQMDLDTKFKNIKNLPGWVLWMAGIKLKENDTREN